MKLEPFVLEWNKVVAALLHGSLLQLLTNSLGEDASIHAFCRPWFMFTVADPSGSELAGAAAPRPGVIVVRDGL